jgi:SnoaL-like domain
MPKSKSGPWHFARPELAQKYLQTFEMGLISAQALFAPSELGQSLIDLKGTAALVETHLTSYHRIDMGAQARDLVIGGRYLDRMEKRGSEWRIVHRIMIYDWLRDFGESVDWSKGVLGTPFLSDHSVGAARGDFSEAFFKAR